MNKGSVASFFALVLLLSLPFYALGATRAALPFVPALPISALMAVVPILAAMGLVWRRGGTKAAGSLFTRAFSWRSIPGLGWVVLALAIMPVAFVLTAGLVWLSGVPLPVLHVLGASAVIPAFALFFLGAVAEEIGWQGYAYPRLNTGYSALTAALIVGVVWALWHVVPFALMGRSGSWILWHGLSIVLMRVIMVWLVVNAGQSILIAVLFHMMSNAVWGIFPEFAPWYDPKVMCIVLLGPSLAIVALWGPTTLRGFRFGLRPNS
jgi:uncharacterized protein